MTISTSELEQVRARCQAALERRDLEAAFAEASVLEAELASNSEAAALWLDLLRAQPRRPSLRSDAARIVAAFPGDAALVTRACDALIRCAELAPLDEPDAERLELCRLAAAAAEHCCAGLEGAPGQGMRGFLLASQGNALRLVGEYEQALTKLEAALAEQPERGSWWFNLGLLHKARSAWREALDANRRARVLLGDDKAVLWNLAICATALGDGTSAVEAMRALGHPAELAPSGMPYVPNLPPVQVRAASLGTGMSASAVPDRSIGLELLWATPLSPVHGVVSSPSYRNTSIDYGDVVLWDGVPVGVSTHGGRPVPRFPLLALLRKGDERRFRFVALQQAPDQVTALAEDLPADSQLFIHLERVEKLCARCASGEHLRKHVHEPPEAHRLVYGKLIVPGTVELAAFRAELQERLHRHSGVQLVVPELLEQVGDTVAAGNAHRLWRALAVRETG
jgi:tetratricopeptide (TPR) repeat protein